MTVTVDEHWMLDFVTEHGASGFVRLARVGRAVGGLRAGRAGRQRAHGEQQQPGGDRRAADDGGECGDGGACGGGVRGQPARYDAGRGDRLTLPRASGPTGPPPRRRRDHPRTRPAPP